MDAVSPSSFATHSFSSILSVVVDVAKKAGEIILLALHSNNDSNVHHKSDIDLVTDTDRKVEKFIIETLTTHFPTSLFLAEESADSSKGESLSLDPTWVIDPIDGTTNFVHKHPVFCVSIALAISGKVVVGVVYNPILNELFTATLMGGAFLNGAPIHVSPVSRLDKAVIATNVGVDRSVEGVEYITKNITKFLQNNVQSIRCNGSSAWEMSSVASGRLDAFYEKGIHAWDIAAASLIVTEAGGVVRRLDGGPLDLADRQVLCGNENIVKLVADVLNA